MDNTIIQLFMNTQYGDLSHEALTALFNDVMEVINAVQEMAVEAYQALFQVIDGVSRATRHGLIKICERLSAWIIIYLPAKGV